MLKIARQISEFNKNESIILSIDLWYVQPLLEKNEFCKS